MPQRIIILGSSHAARIYKAVVRQPSSKVFKIFDLTTPGGTLGGSSNRVKINYDLLSNLNDCDHVIVQIFGNDLFEKNIQITQNPKVIHLTKFKSKSDEYIYQLFQILQKILSITKAKVTLIDNVYKHVFCCETHIHPGLIKFQAKRNKQLRSYFSQYTVLDHRKILGLNPRKLKSIKEYREILTDSVHLKPVYYSKIAEFLFKRIFI